MSFFSARPGAGEPPSGGGGPWRGPPRGVLPGVLPTELVLGASEQLAVMLGPLLVWPDGHG